jgi:hypothetical protein
VSDAAEIRAALIQLAKALETERACVLRILKVVERQMETEETPIPVAIPTMQRSVNENNV